MGDIEYCLKKIQFNPEKNSDKVRYASIITGNNRLRDDLTKLFVDKNNLYFDNNLPISEINERLSEFGVFPINQESLYCRVDNPLYDCKDEVFDKISLSHYTLSQREELLKKDSLELHCIPKPQNGAIVVYFLGIKSFDIKHWGIISEVDKDIKVISRWGDFGVYLHNIESTPSRYGDYIMFFERT